MPPLLVKRIAAMPWRASSAVSTVTSITPLTPWFNCRPMLAAAATGSGAISGAFTIIGCVRWSAGVRARTPAWARPFANSTKTGKVVSKRSSIEPSKTKSLSL